MHPLNDTHAPSSLCLLALAAHDVRQLTLDSFTMSKVISGLTPSMGCQILLEGAHEWDLDIFRLHDLAQRRPLTVLAMHVLHERGLVQALRLRTETLAKFFLFVENAYQDVPYHNNQHATDVFHSVHCLLRAPALADAFSHIEIFCALVAAAIHDANHPGRTNGFLVRGKNGCFLSVFFFFPQP
jgi:hypothetical protein